MARPSGRDIRNETLDAASTRLQSSGVRGFSYGDLAGDLQVRAPSIHHHFRRKDDLIAASARRYRHAFRTRVDNLDAPTALDRITAYTALFLSPAERGVLCLCGALAAGWDDIDPSTRSEVDQFFADEIGWLTMTAQLAIAEGDLRDDVDPAAFATTYIAALEGALLLGRTGAGNDDAGAIARMLLSLASASATTR